jgi:hypothetical protein
MTEKSIKHLPAYTRAASIAVATQKSQLKARDPTDLIARSYDRLDRLHERRVWIIDAVSLNLVSVFVQLLRVDHGVPALTVMVAVQPDGDIFWAGDFISGKLPARHFCDVDRDLRVSRRACAENDCDCRDQELVRLHYDSPDAELPA